MSQNLLVERLKLAKRELTALKTAHKRGMGLLKIYETSHQYKDDGIDEGFYDVEITINFSRNFGSYPFFYIYGQIDTTAESIILSIEVEQIMYTDSGYTAIVKGDAVYWTESIKLTGFTVYSTSPINSLSCNWGNT